VKLEPDDILSEATGANHAPADLNPSTGEQE